ncbi:hypothetical protein ONE63_007155 [Megalurothrips usitatus]|uniref:Uncharacterized protein n=1 Tax=Megalurothrips usitatus TaxID=439358 RepID=A0AAV7XV85_9NEOP|nr:hypothetical protein ONE63_007155 [Megalurothrips usitatus]
MGHGVRRRAATAARCVLAAATAAVVVLGVADAATIPGGIGPFRIELRSSTVCPASEKCLKPDKFSVENLKVTRDPKDEYKYTTNADVKSTINFDDSYKTEIRVTRWSAISNGWTNSVFRMTVTKPCSAFKSHRPDIFKQISDLYYDGKLEDCPITPVTAQVRDFVSEGKPPSQVKTLPYGRFRARIKLIDTSQECLHCLDVVTDVLPKRRQ